MTNRRIKNEEITAGALARKLGEYVEIMSKLKRDLIQIESNNESRNMFDARAHLKKWDDILKAQREIEDKSAAAARRILENIDQIFSHTCPEGTEEVWLKFLMHKKSDVVSKIKLNGLFHMFLYVFVLIFLCCVLFLFCLF